MDNKKNDAYYLAKILNDLKFVIENTNGKTQREIEANQLLIDSIMFRLIQIAENNEKLTEEFKNKCSNVP